MLRRNQLSKTAVVDGTIVTAQLEEIAYCFAERIGVDRLIGNNFALDNEGNYSLPVEPYNFEEGKIGRAEQYALECGVSLEYCAFFSDSSHDLPLLSRVGFPVAVNPDSKLKTQAILNGWPVIG